MQPSDLAAAALREKLTLVDCGSADAFARAYIPGAVRLPQVDAPLVKSPADPTFVLPAESVTDLAARLGIGSDTRVVVYDGGQGWAAAYVWWALSYYGHRNVAVLDGGFPRWVESGGAVAVRPPQAAAAAVAAAAAAAAAAAPSPPSSTSSAAPSVFLAHPRRALYATADDVLEALHEASSGAGKGAGPAQLLDSRTVGEYVGTDPRNNARGGHIPGAVNVPHGTLLEADGRLKDPEALKKVFASAGVDLARPVITYCQMGMRGALALLALKEAGAKATVSNYDGSMREWLNDQRYPVAVPPPAAQAQA
jgi:thiosulfate/3-mercaptopyruvate sulfurtransferase